jgi:hypothetical protein
MVSAVKQSKVHKIPATETRKHILKLSRRGIGVGTIADCAGVSATVVGLVRCGVKRIIYNTTAERVLAVDETAQQNKQIVSARESHHILNTLVEYGYTKRQLAIWMGYSGPNPRFPYRDKITAKTALRVTKLVRLLEDGKLKRG